MSKRKNGIFISLEGPDGSGKSTQMRLLSKALGRMGRRVVTTREPGGSTGSAPIRKVLLGAGGKLAPSAELLLFLADRAQHVADTLQPALDAGKIVLCDRYLDSTLAYQGAGRGFDAAQVARLNQFATAGLKPHLTLLFDLDAPRALKRALKGRKADRMESAGADFHKRVRTAFLRLARQEPRRIKVISVSGKGPEQVLEEAMAQLRRLL